MLRALDAWLSTGAVIWLFPLVFLIHDSEEIFTVPRWLRRHRTDLELRLGSFGPALRVLRDFPQTEAEFAVTVACLFTCCAAGSLLATLGSYWLLTAAMGVMTFNVLTHVGQAIAFGGYTPGVVTAVVLLLPYCLYAFGRLFQAGVITWQQVLISFPLGLALVGMVMFIGHGLAKRLVRRQAA